MSTARGPDASPVLSRVVGAVAAIIGVSIGGFDGFIVIRQLQLGGRIEESAAAMISVFALIPWFFSEAGIRLSLNLPSREGSVLALLSWKLMAAMAGGLGVWAATLA